MSKQASLISYFNKPWAIPAIDNAHRINSINDDEDNAIECNATANITGHSAIDEILHILKFGFTKINEDECDKPKCVVCGIILSNDAMKPSKLKRHLNTNHSELEVKPQEYFERKLKELQCERKSLQKFVSTNQAALRASYKVSLCIAKAKKPYSIGEELIMPCVKDICAECLVSRLSLRFVTSLSNNTVMRRIGELAEDVEDQLLQQLQASQYFALQIDESTDVANNAILIVHVR